jgi:nucleotide-binding universal stress UspA family protein
MGTIMMGVDVDHDPPTVLRHAVEEARRRDAALRLLHVFRPAEPLAGFPVPVDRGADRIDQQAEEGRAHEQLLDWVRSADVDTKDVAVELSVTADPRPARALLEHADGAELIVLGGGRRKRRGPRLGSVIDEVARLSPCPVLIVPAPGGRG